MENALKPDWWHEVFRKIMGLIIIRPLVQYLNLLLFVWFKAAFLNGTLSENIYMRQRVGFEDGSQIDAAKFDIFTQSGKSLYGKTMLIPDKFFKMHSSIYK